MAELGLAKIFDVLVENEVDFDALCVCTDLDLEEIGILKGPRIKIASALRRRQQGMLLVEPQGEFSNPWAMPLPSDLS